jgi:hypothetical protein
MIIPKPLEGILKDIRDNASYTYDIKEPIANFFRLIAREEHLIRTGKPAPLSYKTANGKERPSEFAPIDEFLIPLPAGVAANRGFNA